MKSQDLCYHQPRQGNRASPQVPSPPPPPAPCPLPAAPHSDGNWHLAPLHVSHLFPTESLTVGLIVPGRMELTRTGRWKGLPSLPHFCPVLSELGLLIPLVLRGPLLPPAWELPSWPWDSGSDCRSAGTRGLSLLAAPRPTFGLSF